VAPLVVLASSGYALIGLIILLVPYFAPSIVAFVRSHHNKWAIFALNLLLGWTILGWIGSLVWSLTRPAPAP
jgi:T4 superinfection immunity protein